MLHKKHITYQPTPLRSRFGKDNRTATVRESAGKTMLIVAMLLLASSAWAETKIIKNFTLIDGVGQQPLPNAAMVIVDGRIQWVGRAADLKPPAGIAVTDLSGK